MLTKPPPISWWESNSASLHQTQGASIVDAAQDEDADWEAVRRQFVLLRDVVAQLNSELQIVVCDHANLSEQWFQDAVIDNWRNGVALIPADWLQT